MLARRAAFGVKRRDGPSFRRLRTSDLPVVEEIAAATYGGHDYVAQTLPGWLARDGEEHWNIAVEGAAGELLGFEVLTLYDSGCTGWLEALRVHPKHRGCGLATLLQSALVALACDQLGLARVRYTTASGNVPSRLLAARCGLRVVASWGVIMPKRRVPAVALAVRVRAARLRLGGGRRHRPPAAAARQVASCSDASTLLNLAERRSMRFLLQSNWKAYDFVESSVEALLATHELPLVIAEDRQGELVPTSFSWAYHQHDALGLTVFATVYADDLHSTLAHVEAQLTRASEAVADAIMLMYPAELEPEMLALGLAERSPGGPEPRDGVPFDDRGRIPKLCLLFERSFGE